MTTRYGTAKTSACSRTVAWWTNRAFQTSWKGREDLSFVGLNSYEQCTLRSLAHCCQWERRHHAPLARQENNTKASNISKFWSAYMTATLTTYNVLAFVIPSPGNTHILSSSCNIQDTKGWPSNTSTRSKQVRSHLREWWCWRRTLYYPGRWKEPLQIVSYATKYEKRERKTCTN